MFSEYYIVVNEQQQGPYSKETLRLNHITPDTLVWRSGLQDWIKASELPELNDLFVMDINTETNTGAGASDSGWYAMISGVRVGPSSVSQLISQGLHEDTPVWHAGLNEWVPASSQAEIARMLAASRPPHYNSYGQQPPYGQNRDFSQNPQYGQYPQFGANPQYGQNPKYGANGGYSGNQNYNQGNYNAYNRNQPQNAPLRTNWLVWAIVATIVGFLTSCIGAIFGIIGIVQANKANGLYAAGFDEQGDAANNSAKIMTIIAFVLAGIGLVTTVFWWRNLSLLNYL